MSSPSEMQAAEDLCARCDKACVEALQYPDSINSKIDRSMVLAGSGVLCRWHIVYCSGTSFTKWPKDICVADSYAACLDGAISDIISERVRLSCITRGNDNGTNTEEATDIIIFPEHVKYPCVPREQIPAVLRYHTQVLAPRHQAALHAQGDIPTPIQNVVLSEEDQAAFYTAAVQQVKVYPHQNTSAFVRIEDIEQHKLGTAFPIPLGIPETTTWVFLCGHKLRDNRCGVTAPILHQQFNDVFDQKHPNLNDLVEIDLISHVGGHKVAGNVMIHDRTKVYGSVFYGRVEPKHVEAIVDETIINGEILQPITRACHTELW